MSQVDRRLHRIFKGHNQGISTSKEPFRFLNFTRNIWNPAALSSVSLIFNFNTSKLSPKSECIFVQ